MGVLDFAEVDADALLANDAKVADEFDAKRRLEDVAPAAD
jgi:hypothetical protein